MAANKATAAKTRTKKKERKNISADVYKRQLVEHAQVAAQHAGIVHVAVHGALARRNDHEVILVERNVRHMMQQALEHLIGGHDVVAAHGGHGVHNAGVMGVKRDDVLDTDVAQLL